MSRARHRDQAQRVTRILLATQTVSEAGDFIGLAALILLAYGRSGSVLDSAAVFAVRLVPAVLLGTVAGSWLDRPERRIGLVTLSLAGALAIGGVALRPTILLALVASAVLQGTRTASFSLQAAVVVDQVPPARRGPFFASSGVIFQSASVLGYVCGAAITTAIGPRVALELDAATFLVAALLLTRLPRVVPAARSRRPSAFGGVRSVLTLPVLRRLTPVVWIGAIGAFLPEALAPRIAHGAALPILLASMSFGALLTAFLAGRLGVLDRVTRQMVGAVLVGLGYLGGALVLALHAGWEALAVANAFAGAAAVWQLGARTTFARFTPPAEMAQVEATMTAGISSAFSLGTLALAGVAVVSLPLSYAAAGLPLVVVAVLYARPLQRDAADLTPVPGIPAEVVGEPG